ncbi:MAG: hypothetical protein J6R81_05135 [Alistipes sp.]|nr:hypothetical protein [Alistipes sp.]
MSLANIHWQDIVVAIIAIIVAILLIHRVWQFFFCGRHSACDGCAKECRRRHN